MKEPAGVAMMHRQASVIENVFFPAQALAGLSLDDSASIVAMRVFLARFREEAGKAGDAVEKVLLDQLALAHLKVGELYAQAASASKLEYKQLYGNAAARLLGAICQLVSTLTAYRASMRPRRRSRTSSPGSAAKGSGRSTADAKPNGELASNVEGHG